MKKPNKHYICYVIVITPFIKENYGQGKSGTNFFKRWKKKEEKCVKKSTNVVAKVGQAIERTI
jgi:hypothetical protein